MTAIQQLINGALGAPGVPRDGLPWRAQAEYNALLGTHWPASRWADGHAFIARADMGIGCERCGRGESAPVHGRGAAGVVGDET